MIERIDSVALTIAHEHDISTADLWRRVVRVTLDRRPLPLERGDQVGRSRNVAEARRRIARYLRRNCWYRDHRDGRREYAYGLSGDRMREGWRPMSTPDIAELLNVTHGAVVRMLVRHKNGAEHGDT